ncbi:hypothetical protein SKAU_G00055750 [Synaphobranchus kaupii]|uniref:Uncharacterized protein n=1 Tax=Synaphobranchus kaupii TaxID=118154 RepID=A0A9Q1G414_SYNKA|nr:hypothetical protein SKAU_G00055750 [Synaphobranchus kaupii]
MFSQVFTGLNLPHHCNTNWILSIGPNLTLEEQRNLTLPRDPGGAYESCSMFTQVDWDLETIKAHRINSTSECTDGWLYDTSTGTTTLGTEVWPPAVLLLSLLLQLLFGVLSGAEPPQRSFCAIVSHSFSAVGLILLSGITYGVRDWRTLQLVLSAPVLVFVIYYWILPESARWLLTQGKAGGSPGADQKAARVNKSNVPEKLLNEGADHEKVYHKAIPNVIYGVFPLVGGGMCFLLPETLNTELADHTVSPEERIKLLWPGPPRPDLPSAPVLPLALSLQTAPVLSLPSPAYIMDLIHPYTNSRSLRSADQELLMVPRTRLKTKARVGSGLAPVPVWNNPFQTLLPVWTSRVDLPVQFQSSPVPRNIVPSSLSPACPSQPCPVTCPALFCPALFPAFPLSRPVPACLLVAK